MSKQNFFLKDTASIISGALTTFSGLKSEIDNIVKSRFEYFLNTKGMVSREDFEALVDRHEKLNSELHLLKTQIKLKQEPKIKKKVTK